MQKFPTWPMHVGNFCYILSPSRLTTGQWAWGVIKKGTTGMSEQVTVKQKEQVWRDGAWQHPFGVVRDSLTR